MSNQKKVKGVLEKVVQAALGYMDHNPIDDLE
jgi:hypothetical protein